MKVNCLKNNERQQHILHMYVHIHVIYVVVHGLLKTRNKSQHVDELCWLGHEALPGDGQLHAPWPHGPHGARGAHGAHGARAWQSTHGPWAWRSLQPLGFESFWEADEEFLEIFEAKFADPGRERFLTICETKIVGPAGEKHGPIPWFQFKLKGKRRARGSVGVKQNEFPQRVCPHWGVLKVGAQGTLSAFLL